MSFNELGFLSPDLDNWRANVRKGFPERFGLLDEINVVVQRCLADLGKLPPRPDDDPRGRLLTCALWTRQLHLFQGTVINLERGMVANARTLMRSAFETLFFVGASLWVPDFYRTAMCDYKFQQDKLLRMHIGVLKSAPEPDPDTPERVARLERVLAEHHEQTAEYECKPAGFKNIADAASMGMVYDTYYRALSTDAAHVNVWALMNHFNAEDGGIKHGPAVGDYRDTLNIAIVLGGYMIEIVNVGLQLPELTSLYKQIVERVSVLMPPPPDPKV